MQRALITLLLVACAHSARADDPGARKAIAEQYARYDRACLKGMAGVATWCEKTLTPDFTVTAGGKTMSRSDFIGMCKAMAKSPDPMWGGIKEQKVTIDKLTGDKDGAVAEITNRATMVMKDTNGRFGSKGASHKLSQSQRYRETWVKSAGVWKLRKSEGLSSSMLVDGKPPKTAK